MIKKISTILIFLCINTNINASIKDEIIVSFEKIKNISFEFKQTIDEKTEKGSCTIQYPKKIYCSYDNSKKKIIVSNGKSLVIKNRSTNQSFIYPLKKTPFNLILDKDFLLKQIIKSPGRLIDNKYFNFLIKNNDYKINIFFDKNSHNLIGWQTEDAYQNLVIIFIYNIKKNINIDKKLFILPKLI